MNPKKWDELVDQVRRQIEDVSTSIVDSEAATPKDVLSQTKRNIEYIIENSSNPREILYQLPSILQALSHQKLVGVFIVGSDGRVVLHNGNIKSFWPYDPSVEKIRTDCFYDRNDNTPVPAASLPWVRCMSEHSEGESSAMVCRAAGYEELDVEMTVVMLCSGLDSGDVLIVVRDMSQTTKADEYIKNLCNMLENQITAMEAAQRELKLLMDKIGNTPPAGNVLIPPATPLPCPAPTASLAIVARPPAEKRVLVVDDIPVNQKVLVMHLQKLGVSTDTANNGLEAVNACKSKRYPLVLMDLDMPVLNGLEATTDIRKFEVGQGYHTPIVAMTSFDRPGDRERCLQAGMDEFLEKGDSKSKLRELVGHYVFGTAIADVTSPVHRDDKAPSQGLDLDLAWIGEALGKESMEVISQFIFTASSLMDRLQMVIEERNSLQVTHVAYSLKGPCSNMGLSLMGKLCAEIADDSFLGKWNESMEKYKVLRKMFAAVQAQVGPPEKRRDYQSRI
ncbi:MAG TPA: response regulator [Candidatus Obscuribacterales bacterium]